MSAILHGPSYNKSNNENKSMQSAKYYAFDLPDEEVVEKVERMRRAVTKNYGMIKLPSCLDRLSLLGLRECNGSSYVLQQSEKHLGMVQCTFVVFFLTFFFQATCGALLNKLGKKAFFEHIICFGVLFSLETYQILKNIESCTGFL